MTSILPAARTTPGRPAVLGVDGPDLSDLTEDELASVIDAANAAATDALLRVWESKDQAAAEGRAASAVRGPSPVPLWPAPCALGPETFGERVRLRALIAATVLAGLVAWAGASAWVWS
ncbi:hypothetical protein [Kineosporia sp. R_H_3]|uniref:hypothetical protein n=1 Tax=Kineosporia sp. R_H_3 TaxID=1961848 RepID=UPI000B4A773B|nr:hypothetical protein [Kineosporia sp. R_H_3]